jgi:peptide/nickel transport system substrate-binding protein
MKRRTFLTASGAALLPGSFAIARPGSARTVRFVPQANPSLLDPTFTTAQPTVKRGWASYDL